MMLKLEEIIDAAEGREIKRAIAVKMVLLGFKTKDICDLLEVSDAFVSKWKIIYENEGASGLRLHYKGGPQFLTDAQRREIYFHLRDKPHYSIIAWKHSGIGSSGAMMSFINRNNLTTIF